MDLRGVFLKSLVFLASVLAGTRGQNYQMTFSILEEREKDTYVGNVSNNPQFIADIPTEEFGYIRFGFLKQTYVQTLLTLQEMSGVITTAVVIDRESRNICFSGNECQLAFSVAVRSARPQSSFFAIIDVALAIEDLNDNAPLFPHDILNLEISESATAGTSFHIESAVDLDAGLNSVQSYEIQQQDGDFSLDVIKKLDGSFTVKLVVNSQLDRETKDKYRVIIVATDGGKPRKFGALAVNVTVTDINDNAPIFVEKSYNITVRENVTLEATVLQLTAHDKDIGENGRVTYRFAKNQLDARNVNELFRITPDQGELKLKNRLMYSSDSRPYTIIAEAVDNGVQPQTTQIIIRVHILDVGNNRPIIEVNLIGKENSRIVNLSESATPETFVAHINVIDKDNGDNGIVECEISDAKFELQSMNGKGFKVVVKGELNREAQDLHHIQISCHDFGSPQLSASSSFLVSLSDENDCAPVFTQPIFTGSIPENSADFRPFVQIIAFDEDLGNNSVVRYFIDRESTDLKFWIDEVDGSLRADQMFDRETTPVVMFNVIARDLGSTSLSNKATVKLTITDRNDNTPAIKDPVEFSIKENMQSGSFVGMLRASDADIGDNARVVLIVEPELEYSIPFVVFPDGKIQANRELDREKQSVYKFNVVAMDQGSPRLSSSALITVRVNDTNDNAPELKFPKGKNNTAVVYSDVKPGHKVTQIFAEDHDDGANKIVTYDITGGNTEGLFVIDTQDGTIYLKKRLEVVHNKTYHLTIAVRDGGYPQHTTESDLNIVLVRASNSTHEEESSSNKMIVVIVVVLTVVLSVIMIITICFLRRFDHRSKARRNLDIVAPDEKYPKCYMDSRVDYLNRSPGSHDHLTLTYDPMSPVSCPKKKEVSFDIDDHMEHADLRDQHNTTMSTFSVPESEKVRLMRK